MTVEKREHIVIKCDMCKLEVLPKHAYYSRPRIADHDWDICHRCEEGLKLSLSFLTISVGLLIDFEWKESALLVVKAAKNG